MKTMAKSKNQLVKDFKDFWTAKKSEYTPDVVQSASREIIAELSEKQKHLNEKQRLEERLAKINSKLEKYTV